MRTSFQWCGSCKELHDVNAWPPLCMRAPPKRSSLKAPMLIRDSMDPVQSMVDGKFYTSKSALRASYKRHGVVEVGNDIPKPQPRPKPDRKAIRAAVRRAAAEVSLGRRAKPIAPDPL